MFYAIFGCYFFADVSAFAVSAFGASAFGASAFGAGGDGRGVSVRGADNVGVARGGSAFGADGDGRGVSVRGADKVGVDLEGSAFGGGSVLTCRGGDTFGSSAGARRGPLVGRASSGDFTERGTDWLDPAGGCD